jgi:hypothetical protein
MIDDQIQKLPEQINTKLNAVAEERLTLASGGSLKFYPF